MRGALCWAAQSLQRQTPMREGNFHPNRKRLCGKSRRQRPPSGQATATMAWPCGWSGSGLGSVEKDLDSKNERQDLNGHRPVI